MKWIAQGYKFSSKTNDWTDLVQIETDTEQKASAWCEFNRSYFKRCSFYQVKEQSRTYYTLMVKEQDSAYWTQEFGSFNRDEVYAEVDHVRQSSAVPTRTKVIRTDGSQSEINAAEDKLNGRELV